MTGLSRSRKTGLTGERTYVHLFRDWCWLGTVGDEGSLRALLKASTMRQISTSTSTAFPEAAHGCACARFRTRLMRRLTPDSRNELSCTGATIRRSRLCMTARPPLPKPKLPWIVGLTAPHRLSLTLLIGAVSFAVPQYNKTAPRLAAHRLALGASLSPNLGVARGHPRPDTEWRGCAELH